MRASAKCRRKAALAVLLEQGMRKGYWRGWTGVRGVRARRTWWFRFLSMNSPRIPGLRTATAQLVRNLPGSPVHMQKTDRIMAGQNHIWRSNGVPPLLVLPAMLLSCHDSVFPHSVAA